MLVDRCPVWPACNFGVLWPNGWMDQDATWCRRRVRPRPHCVRSEPSSSKEKGTLFGPCPLWPNGRPSQQLLSFCFSVYAIKLPIAVTLGGAYDGSGASPVGQHGHVICCSSGVGYASEFPVGGRRRQYRSRFCFCLPVHRTVQACIIITCSKN